MSATVLAIILICLLLIWLLLRRRNARSDAANAPKARRTTAQSAFHAVSLRFPQDACLAARKMAGRRFLASAPPKLPLPDCDADRCACRFAHHDDRRSGRDRRSPYSPGGVTAGTGSFQKEQRSGPDRRHDNRD